MKRPNRLFPLTTLALTLVLPPCLRAAPPQKWTTGYWAWSGYFAKAQPPQPHLDSLYFLADTIGEERQPSFYYERTNTAKIDSDLPPADTYWAVIRFEGQRVPDASFATRLSALVSALQKESQRRKLPLVGLQLDIDCPTGSLREYSAFLRNVKKNLPPGVQLSITALLDWFRGGTSIGDVIAQVDEFVPQFYDIGPRTNDRAIAAPIDSARWAPLFNRFQKRYRIGVSTISRAIALDRPSPRAAGHPPYIYSDLSSVDIGVNPDFSLSVSRNASNELVLTYRASRVTRVGSTSFEAGQGIQFLLTTPETIRAAVNSVTRMGGYSAGIIFFRWPTNYERNGLSPNEALIAAGLTPVKESSSHVLATDGHCAAVACADLYLGDVPSGSPKPIHYVIRSSAAIDYFLPEKPLATRLANPRHLELTLPAYAGRGRFYLGRIVTRSASTFTLQPGTTQ